MDTWLYITIVTLIAGAGGTGLGGVIGACFKTDSSKTVSLLLSFAGGVMLSIVCFDLILGAIDAAAAYGTADIFIVCIAIAAGLLVVYALNHVIDKRTTAEVAHTHDEQHPETADALDELIHSDHYIEHKNRKDTGASLFVAGVVMAFAIALHNVPEGMTIGASFANTQGLFIGSALTLSVLIGLHNVPEGMSVAVPLISGGMGRAKAILVTTCSGLPTVLGAWLGYWLGDIGPLGLAASLGFASGAMLYVVFGEIFPQAILMYRSKMPAFFIVGGMLLGLIVIYV